MKNFELKVKIESFIQLRRELKRAGATYRGMLRQTDIYFNSRRERLKLRSINNSDFELIYYARPDNSASKLSSYERFVVDTRQFEVLKKILEQSLGTKSVVQKKRELWIFKNTRIHFDTVQGLGTFVEIETVVRKITLAHAKTEHKKVIKMLGLNGFSSIKGSYSDLLKNKKSHQL